VLGHAAVQHAASMCHPRPTCACSATERCPRSWKVTCSTMTMEGRGGSGGYWAGALVWLLCGLCPRCLRRLWSAFSTCPCARHSCMHVSTHEGGRVEGEGREGGRLWEGRGEGGLGQVLLCGSCAALVRLLCGSCAAHVLGACAGRFTALPLYPKH
jgi:hypothetical protein